jgi:hypothetical protein
LDRILHQVATICELLDWYSRVKGIVLPLWLLGYDVPVEKARATLLRYLDGQLVGMAGDQRGEDAIGDHIAEVAHSASYSTRLRSSRVAGEQFLLPMLNVFANPHYKPLEEDEGIIANFTRAILQMAGIDKLEERQRQLGNPFQSVESTKDFLAILQRVSLPDLREAVASATEAELLKTRAVFIRILAVLRALEREMGEQLAEPYRYNALAHLGIWGFPGLLVLRRTGYGPAVEMLLADFTDADIEDRLSARSQQTLEEPR